MGPTAILARRCGADRFRVRPGFFDLFQLPRLAGRDFTWDDGPGKPAVALLSASLARALFPAGDVVGHHFRGRTSLATST